MAAKLRVADSGYHAELDAAERASRDEITALQTRRLAWSRSEEHTSELQSH